MQANKIDEALTQYFGEAQTANVEGADFCELF